jgi:hypothetical protein
VQTDGGHPFIDEASVLPGAHMVRMVDATGKRVVGNSPSSTFKPHQEASAYIGGQFELNRSAGLLLHYYGSCPYIRSCNDIADLDLDQIATAQLAVDRQIEKCTISQASFAIEEETDCPDLLLRKRSLCANGLASVPSHATLHGWIIE